jgi:hypothetical protein
MGALAALEARAPGAMAGGLAIKVRPFCFVLIFFEVALDNLF